MKKDTIANSNNALINNIQNDTYRLIRDAGRIILVLGITFFAGYWYAKAHGIEIAEPTALVNTGSLLTGLTITGMVTGTGVLPATGASGDVTLL